MQYCLYKLTFAQAINLLDTYNERQRKAHEAQEAASKQDDPDYVDIDKYKVDKQTEELPSFGDLKAAFGNMFGK